MRKAKGNKCMPRNESTNIEIYRAHAEKLGGGYHQRGAEITANWVKKQWSDNKYLKKSYGGREKERRRKSCVKCEDQRVEKNFPYPFGNVQLFQNKIRTTTT